MDRYTIDRNEAAALLEVSLRTIDRYIQKKKFSCKKKQGKIFFAEDEIRSAISKTNIDMVETSLPSKKSLPKFSPPSPPVSMDSGEKEIFQKQISFLQNMLQSQQQKLLEAYTENGQLKQKISHLLPLPKTLEKKSEDWLLLQKKYQNTEFVLRIYFAIIVISVALTVLSLSYIFYATL